MQFQPLISATPEVKAQVRTLRNQACVRKFMYTSHEITPSEHDAWLASLSGNKTQKVFVIMNEGLPAGVVSLSKINTTQKTADWAFYLDSSYQGKGLGSKVEFWMLDQVFCGGDIDKLNCEVLETNPAVVKMHQKFGFSIEGVRRKNILKDGARIDVILLGITKEEWNSQRPKILPLIERLTR